MVRTRRGFIVGLTSVGLTSAALLIACKSSNEGSDVALDGGTHLPDGASGEDANAGGSDAGGDAQASDDASVGTDGSADGATNDAGGEPTDASTDDAGGEDAAAPDPMTLTSPAVVDGRFAAANTCNGTHSLSPALSWTAGPNGTASYAIVLKDLTVPNVHWILYDIPAGTLSVAAAIPHGAQPGAPAPQGSKQSKVTFSPATYGYLGPCPPKTPTPEHDYVFTVYALANATVTGAASSDSPESIEAKIQAQKVNASAEASLHAKYAQP